jgi:hypothetical protein
MGRPLKAFRTSNAKKCSGLFAAFAGSGIGKDRIRAYNERNYCRAYLETCCCRLPKTSEAFLVLTNKNCFL